MEGLKRKIYEYVESENSLKCRTSLTCLTFSEADFAVLCQKVNRNFKYFKYLQQLVREEVMSKKMDFLEGE